MDLVADAFQKGGMFMYIILAVLAVGIAIAFERWFYISRTESSTTKLWKRLAPMLKAVDIPRAESLAKQTKSPLGRVLEYGFARWKTGADRERIEASMEEGVMEVIPQLEQRTHYLATLANIATLLGLLGTILGLIQAFNAVANADPALKADMLSASISVAMNTTAFGLVAAIPLILIHSYLSAKTSRLVDAVEMASVKCLNLITEDDPL